MSNNQLDSLFIKKSKILSQKNHVQNQISTNHTKINRLQIALTELTSEVGTLTSINNTVQSLTIHEARWKGEKKDQFVQHYDVYKDYAKDLVKGVDTKKELVREEILRAESNRAILEGNLVSLQSQLNQINTRIEIARKEE